MAILREIYRLYRQLPVYTVGNVTREIKRKEAEIRALAEKFKALDKR